MPGPISGWDRPSVFMANLLQGDIEGAGRALVAPSSLAPEKTRTLGEMLAGQAARDPLVAGIMSVVTDPFFIIGIALSLRYPIAKMKDLFKVGARWGAYAKRMGTVEAGLLRGETLFGPEINEQVISHLRTQRDMEMSLFKGPIEFVRGGKTIKARGLGPLVDDLVEKLGRQPTPEEWYKVGGRIEGWDKGVPGFVSQFVGRFRSDLSAELARTAPLRGPIELPAPFEPFIRDYKVLKDAAFEHYIRPFFARNTNPNSKDYGKLLYKGGPAAVKVAMGLGPGDPFLPAGELSLERASMMAADEILDSKLVGYLRSHLYHVPIHSVAGDQRFMQMISELANEERAPFTAKEVSGVARAGPPASARYRTGIVMPDPKQLLALNPNPRMLEIIEAAAKNFEKMTNKDLTAQALESIRQAMGAGEPGARAAAINVAVDAVAERLGALGLRTTGFTRQLDAVKALANAGRTAEVAERLSQMGSRIGTMAYYPLDPITTFQAYASNISRPYSWLIRGHGAAIAEAAKVLPQHTQNMLADYTPMLRGRTNYSQTMQLIRWNNLRLNLFDRLEGPLARKLLPEKWRGALQKKLMEPGGPFSYLNAMNGTASWFYLSTLGVNLSSAFGNLLQTPLTLAPLIGVDGWAMGVERTLHKLTNAKTGYFSLRAAGMDDVAAMQKAFPEFSKTASQESSLTTSMMQDTLHQAWGQGMATLPENLRRLRSGTTEYARAMEWVKKHAMTLFASSERWNRLVSFEGAYAKYLQQELTGNMTAAQVGMVEGDALNAADKVVRMTQFAAGPLQMPNILRNVPPPLRQFMYFPMRYLGYLVESTRMPWGAGPMAAPYSEAAMNFGTVGRGMAVSSALFHGAKETLGLNLTRGLMMGAMPLPQSPDMPFFPIPIIPPVLAIPGGLMKSLYSEDPQELARVGALLVPGGIAGLRAYRTIRSANYLQPGPNGLIPTFNLAGDKIADVSPMQVWMRALGFRPDDVEKEREMTAYLLKQRDKIRGVRKQYVESLLDNDPEAAQSVQEGFQKQYPMLGPLVVGQTDLRAAQSRRDLTRIQRLLQTMPAQYRQYFQEVAAGAYANEFNSVYSQAPPYEPPPLSSLLVNQPAYSTPGGVMQFGQPAVPWTPANFSQPFSYSPSVRM